LRSSFLIRRISACCIRAFLQKRPETTRHFCADDDVKPNHRLNADAFFSIRRVLSIRSSAKSCARKHGLIALRCSVSDAHDETRITNGQRTAEAPEHPAPNPADDAKPNSDAVPDVYAINGHVHAHVTLSTPD
jgi:hypothetical protein